MKEITTNKLQSELSKVIKEVENGQVYEIKRYSKPVAFLISKGQYETILSRCDCKECLRDLRKIAKKIKE